MIIGRPSGDTGISPGACRRMLAENLVLHTGPTLPFWELAWEAGKPLPFRERDCGKADLIIGARRMADAVRLSHQDVFMSTEAVRLHSTLQNIRNMRGLLLLFPATWDLQWSKKLLDLLGTDTEVICGISSVVYFMAKISLSWEDAKIVSAHGKTCNLVSLIRNHKRCLPFWEPLTEQPGLPVS